MANIYTAASEVVIWLGPEDVAVAFKVIPKADNLNSEYGTKYTLAIATWL